MLNRTTTRLDTDMNSLVTTIIEASIDVGNTWAENVDNVRLVPIGNIGLRQLWVGGEVTFLSPYIVSDIAKRLIV